MYDVIIVGGGIMGCSVAYHLLKFDCRLKIAVIEPDPTYSKASTTLSLANIRIQFSLRENIEISRYTFEVLEHFEEEMEIGGVRPTLNFKHEGNLFLTDKKGEKQARQALELQQNLGCSVGWKSPENIREDFPLYNASEFTGGTFGHWDGHIDAYSFLTAYRAKARLFGAELIADRVVDVFTAGSRVNGVYLASGEKLRSPCIVNCAGAWAADVARFAGVRLPIEPVKRQVYVLDTQVKPDRPLPLTVLPSGLYFRSETGNLILLGKSVADDPVGFDFSWNEKRFVELLWPELMEAVPAFDRLKVVRGWAGLYAVNRLDGNAVLGEWPGLKGFFVANGFSGHGLQQAPAVGRYLAERILERVPTLDLSIFAPDRIPENRPLGEAGLV